MNSYYYGKSGKGDYNKEDLPQNRWQLFWEMLRVRLSGLVRLNLLYVLVWIPTIAVILISFLQWQALFGAFINQDITAEFYSQGWYSIVFMGLLYLIPCIAITGPFTAGVSYVNRNWARDEHAFIWSDFKDALKENWKQALGISTITGFIPFIVFLCWRFYGGMVEKSMFFIVPQVLTLIIGLFWALGLVFFYYLLITYKHTFREVIKNGLILALGQLPQTLGIRLVTLLPGIIGLVFIFIIPVPLQWPILFLIIYYGIFGYCFTRFVYASYTNGVFDRFINAKIEGVEVNRGLRAESDEDDDEYEDENFEE